jgi:hypothetical protein
VLDHLLADRPLAKLHYVGGGEPESRLRPTWKRFEILSSVESGEDTLHSAPVRIYDGGMWVATLHAGVDLTRATLAHDVRTRSRRRSGRVEYDTAASVEAMSGRTDALATEH